VSAEIVRRAPVPVLLAGGLGPDNVAGAVKTVRPWGVDVCSGLRDGSGRLVSGRVEAFFAAVQPVDGV
jgi:phosphoribosylanthranilate isomerase